MSVAYVAVAPELRQRCTRAVEIALLHGNREEAMRAIDRAFEAEPTEKVSLESWLSEVDGISVRTLAGLENANIRFVGELIDCPIDRILGLKNFAQKTLKEIREALWEHGWKLRDDVQAELRQAVA